MSRFRERDVRRLIRSIENAGKEIAAVEIAADGKIVVVVGKQPGGGNKETELDTWIEKHHAHDA